MEGDRRKQERDNVHRGRRGVQDKSKRHHRTMGKEIAERESRRGRAPQDLQRVERGDMNENIPARPNGLCEKLETVISDRRPEPTRIKEEVLYQWSSVGVRKCTDLPVVWQSKRG